MTSGVASQSQVVTAASFVVEFTGSPIGRMAFSELGGITSKVASQEYIFSDATGKVNHTKQFGKTEPPTITLKRGLDQAGSNAILAWHAFARGGDTRARCPGTLTVFDAGGTQQAMYLLEGAWVSEVNITSVKAGTSDVAMIECKITCESISGRGNG
ncbi:phage tail protein [Amycolatopsis sp. OK19-0408]|uniref:Phage tail protein n=1 Tax=Amycolatopsis iheyensis TaxID=2945988 RepID=A0A9X2NI25_9PSEU|nr:phage tail protein [Amycolatopsis iheyensis]MCR6487821.1 phage tail protein [Amycolatopsis iheyensis]